MKHVQGRKVKHSNRNNSGADCSISLIFRTHFHHVTGDTVHMFKVKGQRSKSQHNIRVSSKNAIRRIACPA